MSDINTLYISDECRNCSVRGDLDKCRLTPCVYHNTWIVKELESRLSAMQEVVDKAVKFEKDCDYDNCNNPACDMCNLLAAVKKYNEVCK